MNEILHHFHMCSTCLFQGWGPPSRTPIFNIDVKCVLWRWVPMTEILHHPSGHNIEGGGAGSATEAKTRSDCDHGVHCVCSRVVQDFVHQPSAAFRSWLFLCFFVYVFVFVCLCVSYPFQRASPSSALKPGFVCCRSSFSAR